MSTNPSNIDGIIQSQQCVVGIVVDDNDPKQTGRCKIRILGHQDDIGKIPDDKLQWISPIVNGSPQIRQVGRFGSTYLKGSKVVLQNLGLQGWAIAGALSNDENDPSKQDINHVATDNSPMLINNGQNVAMRLFNGQSSRALTPSTQSLYKLIGTNSHLLQDPIAAIHNLAPTPEIYGKRTSIKVPAGQFKSIGFERYFGEVKNVQSFMSGKSIPALIPNALGMIEQLKKTAIQGLNIPAIDSVGGLQNILGALQGISSMQSSANQGTATQDAANQEEELRRIYIALTGKQPLDRFGNETLEYKAWRTAYLNGEPLVG
jgi:hypothetical protein